MTHTCLRGHTQKALMGDKSITTNTWDFPCTACASEGFTPDSESVDGLVPGNYVTGEGHDRWLARAVLVEVEVERLREALRAIAAESYVWPHKNAADVARYVLGDVD